MMSTKQQSLAGRAVDLYANGGLGELAGGLKRFGYYRSLPYVCAARSKLPPRTQAVRVGDQTARFYATEAHEVRRYWTLMDEGHILEDFLSELQPDDTVWDVGAHVGLYTVFAAQRADTVAIEPGAENVGRLCENLTLNDSDAQAITCALGARTGTADLALAPEDGVHTLATADSGMTVTVPMETGDRLVAQGEAPPPTVVKIDVEGAEVGVLAGLRETLPDCRVVYVEVHPDELDHFGHDAMEVKQLLGAAGFTIDFETPRHSTYHVKATAEGRP